jgi:hypothetical protein
MDYDCNNPYEHIMKQSRSRIVVKNMRYGKLCFYAHYADKRYGNIYRHIGNSNPLHYMYSSSVHNARRKFYIRPACLDIFLCI